MALISKLTNIADAIREKTGESGTLTLDAMAAAIEALETGGGVIIETGTITLAENKSENPPIEIASKGYLWPDAVITYKKPAASIEGVSSTTGIACEILTNKVQEEYNNSGYAFVSYDAYSFQRNNGTNKTYMPYVSLAKRISQSKDATYFPFNWTGSNTAGAYTAGTTYGYVYIWGAAI